jgi:hypothetical protein
MKWLTRAGQESTEFKNEFILLSDCLGLSVLLDELNHPKPPVSTKSLVATMVILTTTREQPNHAKKAHSGQKTCRMCPLEAILLYQARWERSLCFKEQSRTSKANQSRVQKLRCGKPMGMGFMIFSTLTGRHRTIEGG